MAGARAASWPSRAGTILGVRRARGTVQDFLERAEPWLRYAVPTMLGVFLASLALSAVLQVNVHRRDIVSDAREQVDLVAKLAAAALGTSTAPATERLAALSGVVLRDGREILLLDAPDTIVAALPARPGPLGTLSGMIDEVQPLVILGERAGVMAVTTRGGEPALAAVRNLANGRGQVAVIQPLPRATARWWAQAIDHAALLGAAALVIVCTGLAYVLQAHRARVVDEVCERVRQRLDTALSRGRCGLWDWDVPRGRIYWSDSMYELLGYSRAREFLSFGEVNALVHPEDSDLYGLAGQLAGQHATVDHEFRLRSASGAWVWLKARAEIVTDADDGGRHLIGICVDVTEQRRLAESSATADARLRDAVEAISEAFVLWDASNHLVLCNSKFRTLHGLPDADGLPGQRYEMVMGASAPPPVRREVVHGAGSDDARTFEAELGDGRWLQVSERRTKDGGYVSVGTDITPLKRQQERLVASERALMATVRDLKRSREALEYQTQQMAELAERYYEQKAHAESAHRAKSEFLANMSHELRTPLNAVIGFAEVMAQETFGPLGSAKYLEYCRDISGSGAYLLSMIDDVLDMSRIEARRVTLHRDAVAIDGAVSQALRLMAEPAQAKRLAIHRDCPADVVALADPRALQQILVNLLQNAVKFTRDDGRIALRARPAGGFVHVFVEDDGVGIPREALHKLGRPFEQVENEFTRSHKGSGLGLAIASSLAQLHGGALRIRSEPGIGTIVLVRLPRAAATTSQACLSAREPAYA